MQKVSDIAAYQQTKNTKENINGWSSRRQRSRLKSKIVSEPEVEFEHESPNTQLLLTTSYNNNTTMRIRREENSHVLIEDKPETPSLPLTDSYLRLLSTIEQLKTVDWESTDPELYKDSPFAREGKKPFTPHCFWAMVSTEYFPKLERVQFHQKLQDLKKFAHQNIEETALPFNLQRSSESVTKTTSLSQYFQQTSLFSSKKLPSNSILAKLAADLHSNLTRSASKVGLNRHLSVNTTSSCNKFKTNIVQEEIPPDTISTERLRSADHHQEAYANEFILKIRNLIYKKLSPFISIPDEIIDSNNDNPLIKLAIAEKLPLDTVIATCEEELRKIEGQAQQDLNKLSFNVNRHFNQLIGFPKLMTTQGVLADLEEMSVLEWKWVTKTSLKKSKAQADQAHSEENQLLTLKNEEQTCQICGDGDYVDGNLIVYCSRCNICVHQNCYGIQSLPKGNWICELCRSFGPQGQLMRCPLCPSLGGCLRRTQTLSNSDRWLRSNVEYLHFIKAGNRQDLDIYRSFQPDPQFPVLSDDVEIPDGEYKKYLYYDHFAPGTIMTGPWAPPRPYYSWVHVSCHPVVPLPLMNPLPLPPLGNELVGSETTRRCEVCKEWLGILYKCTGPNCSLHYHGECARKIKIFLMNSSVDNSRYCRSRRKFVQCFQHMRGGAKDEILKEREQKTSEILNWIGLPHSNEETYYQNRPKRKPSEQVTQSSEADENCTKESDEKVEVGEEPAQPTWKSNKFVREVMSETCMFPGLGNVWIITKDESEKPKSVLYIQPVVEQIPQEISILNNVWLKLQTERGWDPYLAHDKLHRILEGSDEPPFTNLIKEVDLKDDKKRKRGLKLPLPTPTGYSSRRSVYNPFKIEPDLLEKITETYLIQSSRTIEPSFIETVREIHKFKTVEIEKSDAVLRRLQSATRESPEISKRTIRYYEESAPRLDLSGLPVLARLSDYYNPPKVPRPCSTSYPTFCVCNSKLSNTRFMIACSMCMNWFHPECIGIPISTPPKSKTTIICHKCRQFCHFHVQTSDSSLGKRKMVEPNFDEDDLNIDCSKNPKLFKTTKEKLERLFIKFHDRQSENSTTHPI